MHRGRAAAKVKLKPNKLATVIGAALMVAPVVRAQQSEYAKQSRKNVEEKSLTGI